MKNYDVLVLVGGISKASINKSLFREILKLDMQNIVFDAFDISTLPFFSQDIENDYPENVVNLKERIKKSDAVLFITPEYNRTIPAVLKNAIELGSRPYGDNSFNGKPAAIMGASTGSIGTFGAQQHLRNSCSSLNLHLMSQPEFYFNASVSMGENGIDAKSVEHLRRFIVSFEEWIDLFKEESQH